MVGTSYVLVQYKHRDPSRQQMMNEEYNNNKMDDLYGG